MFEPLITKIDVGDECDAVEKTSDKNRRDDLPDRVAGDSEGGKGDKTNYSEFMGEVMEAEEVKKLRNKESNNASGGDVIDSENNIGDRSSKHGKM